jgi:hypothetical protein
VSDLVNESERFTPFVLRVGPCAAAEGSAESGAMAVVSGWNEGIEFPKVQLPDAKLTSSMIGQMTTLHGMNFNAVDEVRIGDVLISAGRIFRTVMFNLTSQEMLEVEVRDPAVLRWEESATRLAFTGRNSTVPHTGHNSPEIRTAPNLTRRAKLTGLASDDSDADANNSPDDLAALVQEYWDGDLNNSATSLMVPSLEGVLRTPERPYYINRGHFPSRQLLGMLRIIVASATSSATATSRHPEIILFRELVQPFNFSREGDDQLRFMTPVFDGAGAGYSAVKLISAVGGTELELKRSLYYTTKCPQVESESPGAVAWASIK